MSPCNHAAVTTFRIAVAQPTATPDVRENGRSVRRMMRLAKEQEARLVHFPEGHLSGYAVEQVEAWEDVDWAAVREELQAVAALASELSVWVVLGSAHPLTPPNRPHNSLYVISDEGDLLQRLAAGPQLDHVQAEILQGQQAALEALTRTFTTSPEAALLRAT